MRELKPQTVYLPTENYKRKAIGVYFENGNYGNSGLSHICDVEETEAIILTEEELQQEKDKFAILFFKWVRINFYEFHNDFCEFEGYQRKILKDKIFHISELLNIYKEELAKQK